MRFENYCIPSYLMKEYLNYQQFKVTTAQATVTAASDLFKNLEFLVLFCQTMKMLDYCEHVANLCVLTIYNMDKFSPCNIFYTAQTALINAGTESYHTKLVPFLFYAKGRAVSDELNKVIDFRYKYTKNDNGYESDAFDGYGQYPVSSITFGNIRFSQINRLFLQMTNRISLMLVTHALNGSLQAIQPFKLDDLNLCGMSQQHIHFGENLASACQMDLRDLLELGERKPWFMNLYLNYTENNLNLVKSVPILIRNSFTYNMVRRF